MTRSARPATGRRPVVGRCAALLLTAGVLLAGCSSGAEEHDHGSDAAAATVSGPDSPYDGLYLQTPYQKPEFTLTDRTGAPYDFGTATAGAPTLLFFGYTNCPDVCPTTMADVATALRTVDPAVAQQVRVVFVTTDPAQDTPEVLGEYLDRFDRDLAVDFVGLTGDQAQIDQAQLAAGVPLAEDMGRQHSSLLLLYGADGEADVAFDAGNTARDIAHDLTVVAGA
ncbi:SCO family protein [Modestobacter sp. I12A-02628]|uniref:SCO family protein n=1 Tax=Goekera deserti TaxID=2497753 RepID=A0A7K3WC03_9ACTN|nr:SCO family protein [Goekera deserti]MPQ98406.1 SCO family protein [Goekera deserti]NDI48233.1 SCO family protein [Goekera deserti]NEL53982.1 SCO family protein [Goekera deserti]